MARRAVPTFPAMVIAIPLVIGIAAISTNRHTESMERSRAAAEAALQSEGTLLDQHTKSFVVVGYSTSYVWPRMLQDMLDDHAGGERTYHVFNASVGQSPVPTWIDETSGRDHQMTFGAMLRDYFGDDPRLRENAPAPSIALCQQSLQGLLTPKGPIETMADKDGIKAGADALERLATMLHEQGVDRVYVAMHIYKQRFEPNVGNERLALHELMTREHDFVFEGPDVWSITIAEFPEAYDADRVHPNERGMKLMAEAWYRTIAGDQVKQAVIDRMHKRAYDVEDLIREYITSRVPG